MFASGFRTRMKETHITEKASRTAQTQINVDDDEIDLMELVRALWRGKWIILSSVLAGMFLAGYYVFGVAEPQYRSTAQLTLEMRSKPVVDIESVISGASTEQAALNTEVEIILSRRILGQVVDALDLEEDPEFNSKLQPPSLLAVIRDAIAGLGFQAETTPGTAPENASKSPRDRAIGALRGALSASVQRDTYVFTIAATTNNPSKSARIVNTLSESYIQD